ncbi:MAG: YceD family protein [Solirubrobacterales bacterium]
MAANHHTRTEIDLARLALSPGQGTRLEAEVDPGGFELGGNEYGFGERPVTTRLDVSRTAAGYAMRLRFSGELTGPCVRCLEAAAIGIEVDAREVDQPTSGDEELLSPYVSEGILDLSGWARDALVLALPQQLLCRPDCAGLCPVCGESLNDAEEGAHEHPKDPDPRWAKLRELQ